MTPFTAGQLRAAIVERGFTLPDVARKLRIANRTLRYNLDRKPCPTATTVDRVFTALVELERDRARDLATPVAEGERT